MSDGKVKIDVLLDDDSAVKSINKMETAFKKASDQFNKIDDTKMSNVVSLSKDASDELKKVETATNKFGDELLKIDGSKMSDVVSLSKEASTGFKDVEGTTSNFGDELQQIDDSKLKDVVNTSDKASTSIKGIVTSLGLVKIATAAFNVLKGSLDGAIARFDTMNQFPRVLEKMGFSAEQSERAIRKLSDGIQGLPTTLDGIASVAQRIASMSGDLAQASDVALALNNAFLASGASAEQASSGMEQYIQMLSTGQADMQSWKILEETMKYALDETARSFLGATANSRGLYEALQSGEITFDQFGNKLIELSTATGGFAETALESSKGLQTSFQNIGTAVVSGIERIIRKTNDLVKNITGKEIYEHLDTLKGVVSTVFLSIGRSIDTMTPLVKGVATVFGTLMDVAKKLDFVIIGLAASFGAYKTLVTVSNNLAKLRVAFSILTVVKTNATLATKLYTAEQIRAATSSTVAATAIALLTGKISLMSLATSAASTAMAFLSGPVGWAVIAIGALAGAGFLAYKHFMKLSPEILQISENSKDAAEASEKLRDSIDDSADSFTNRMSTINGQTESLRKLMEQTIDLSRKENLTAGDKKILKANVDDLNASVAGLSLAYDGESESLNMSAEAMKTRLNLMDQEQQFNAARERGIEIEKEKADIYLQQQVNAELLARAQEELDSKMVGSSGYTELWIGIKNLKDEQEALGESYTELGTAAEITARIQEESAMAAAAAQQEATALGISSINDLEGAQRGLAESAQSAYQAYADTATNAFEKVDDTAKASIEEMIANSAYNKQAMLQMAEDATVLRGRFQELGLDESIIDQFIAMGDEGPALIAELATATDSQLDTLVSNTDAKSGDLKDAFMKMFEIDEEDFIKGFGDVITTMEDTLSKQLAESDLRESVREAFTGDGEASAAIGKEVGTQIAEGLGGAGAEFETAGGTLAESTATGLTNNQSVVVEAAQGMMTEVELATTTGSENMQTTMETGMETLKSVVESGFKAVLEAITSSLNQAVNVSQDTSSKVVENLNTAVSGATQAGRDTGAGFRIGLEGQRSSIMATAGSIASDAVKAMKSALDSNSPSKKTMAVGEDTGEGYVIGMENLFGKVKQAAGKLASLAVPGVGMTSQSFGMGSLSHGLAESALPRFDMNALFSQSMTQPLNTINNSTNNTTQVTKVDNSETNALLRLIADKNVTINIDGQRLADQLTPHVSSIMGNNITDIRRGW